MPLWLFGFHALKLKAMSRTLEVFGLNEEEFSERVMLQYYQRCTARWFSREEYDRLAELNKRVADHKIEQCYRKAINKTPTNND